MQYINGGGGWGEPKWRWQSINRWKKRQNKIKRGCNKVTWPIRAHQSTESVSERNTGAKTVSDHVQTHSNVFLPVVYLFIPISPGLSICYHVAKVATYQATDAWHFMTAGESKLDLYPWCLGACCDQILRATLAWLKHTQWKKRQLIRH